MAPAIKTILLLVVVGSAACKTTLNIPNDRGYQVQITSSQAPVLEGELIVVDEKNLIVAIDQKLHLVDYQNMDQLLIPELRAPGKTPVMWGVAAITAGAGTIILISGDGAVAGVLGLAAGLGALASSRAPREKYKTPFSTKQLQRLKRYCRYPQGLSPPQLEQLLSAYDQQEMIRDGL